MPSDGEYKWYYGGGSCPENFYAAEGGRDDAVREGWANYPEGDFTVCEADKALPSFEVMPADWIIERYEECNEECWGEDGADIAPSNEQERELEAAMAETLKSWMVKHGLQGRVWNFGNTRAEEYFAPIEGNVAAPATR